MPRAFGNIVEPLINYTCERFNEITPQKLASITLTYEIIREAAADLYGTNKEYKQSAEEYFSSDLFKHHCDCVGISEILLMYIINNPTKYNKEPEDEGFYETNSEF